MSRGRLSVSTLLLVACSTAPSAPADRAARGQAPAETAAEATAAPPDAREALLARTVGRLLETEHLRHRRLDDDLAREAFRTYVDRLDPSRMFLLAKDAQALDGYAARVDDELHDGGLDLAHDGARRFVARVAVVDKLVAELLAAPLDLTNDEDLELDPKKVALATTEDELRDRWRRRLELEVLERVEAMEARLAEQKDRDKGKDAAQDAGAHAAEGAAEPPVAAPSRDPVPATPEERQARARKDLATAYAGRFARLRNPAPLGPASDLLNAVAAAFDPHTAYLPPADKANFDIHLSGSLEGIGALLREHDHLIEIVELIPGGAAWRLGKVAPGDLVLSVANAGLEPVDVTDLRIDDVVKMIRGPKGTVVRLRLRKATGEEQTVPITRDVVVIEEAYARGALVTPTRGHETYGYVYLPSFYGGSGPRTATRDVRRLLEEMQARKVAGVILDLRGNGGGFLTAAVEITGLFIDHGPVVQVEAGGGQRQVLRDDDQGTAFEGPVVVLVDRFSASASEIVAGALQDYHRAVIVGTGPTHGKGTVQSLVSLDRVASSDADLGVLKLTIQQFFRVSGASTQREGVLPDVVLPDPAGHVEAGERKLEHAIPWSSIAAVEHDAWGARWKTEILVARSAARVAADAVFIKLAVRTALLRKWSDDTRVPLARPAWEARRAAHKAALEATSTDLDKGPARLQVKLLGDEAPRPPPAAGTRTDDRLARWRESLARDPWVEESLLVLGDVAGPAAAP